MRGLNKAMLIGNVGKDPEVQSFESGRKRATFSLATSEKYRDKNGVDQTITDWHNIVVWGPQADVVEKYIRRGMPIFVEGRIKTREYEAQDGQKKRITEILADNFSMLGGRQDDSSSQEINKPTTPPETNAPDTSVDIADDLPF
jgi:single-strand DNA-binding protein